MIKHVTLIFTLMLVVGIAVQTTAQTVQTPNALQTQKTAPAQKTKPAMPTTMPAAMPSVDQILEKYVQAIGGRAAMRKLTSRAAQGTFEITAAGIKAPAELYEKAPNKMVQIVTIPGFGVIQSGYNGTVAFEQQPQSGLRELSGKELAKMKRQADFYDDLNLTSSRATRN